MTEKMSMPSSGGGLLSYKDEFESKFKIKPQAIIAAIVVFIVILLILRYFY